MPPLLLLSLALTATPMVGPLTQKDGVVAVQVFDRMDGAYWHQRFHVELVDLATGQRETELTGWSQLLGELPDGALVVTNQGTEGAKTLKVGVVERTGALRFACETPFDAGSYLFTWWQGPGQLSGTAIKDRPISGLAVQVDPDEHLMQVSFSRKSCTLKVPKRGASGSMTVVPRAGLTAPGFETRLNGAFLELVWVKEGAVIWSRRIDPAPLQHPPG